jgi:protein TonB
MNAMALQPMMPNASPIAAPRWLGNSLAAGCALALHGAVALALLANWQLEPPAPQTAVLKTQLVMLPAPAPAPVVEPTAVAEPARPVPEPVQAAVQPEPAPVAVAPPKPDQALLARKRVKEQERERQREQAKVQQQQREQQREREREQTEQQARVAQQAEQARQQQLADAAKAQAQTEAQAQAETLASRQYLPISKDAPDYPQRALDKGIQGDCTVEYQVNSQGRVENPQVVGNCHPMFIRPSLAAAKTFVYQPRMVGGKAVQVPGVRNTFHYRIE